MPELPEVETVLTQLEDKIADVEITDAWSHESKKFSEAVELIGASLTQIRRRGKFLITATDDDRELIVHLGMTGKLRVVVSPTEDKYIRAWWQLEDKQENKSILEYSDVRRFGRIKVVATGDYSELATLKAMGPEPFDPELTAEIFWENLKKSSRYIKTQLLSQKPIAGVGNIYADEALWLSKVNPELKKLTKQQAERLLEAIQNVLSKGIDNGGTTLRDYRDANGEAGRNQTQLSAYGRAGEPCFRCSTELSSTKLDARTTTWCKSCQK